MIIEKGSVELFNEKHIARHERQLSWLKEDLSAGGTDAEGLIAELQAFQVAIPSWALGTGGTRFGRFPGGGEPGSLEQKIEDIGLLHALNKSSGAVSLHIPWDIPEDAGRIKMLAENHGIRFDAVNSNTFQDQKGQARSYKFGSLSHTEAAVRKQAVEHNLAVIRHGIELGSRSLSLWLSDGSCFPGQQNFARAFNYTLESLREIYSALPADWQLLVEYKPYEPNFYSTVI
ncbi:MAG TPA: sugar isomerase, partial [Anseongella sp.]|nr:sugar isomerase [Anseongella sp.]